MADSKSKTTVKTSSLAAKAEALMAKSAQKPAAKAPAKAAAIMPKDFTWIPFPRKKIRVSATVSFAPEEMPSTYGPAMGLPKNVCKRNPEIASAPPRKTAARILGSRTFQRI